MKLRSVSGSRNSVGERGKSRSAISILSVSSILVFIFLVFDSSNHCKALKLQFGNKKNDEATDKLSAESTNNKAQQQSSSSSPLPTAILETEARTARELSKAVSTLKKDLKACNSRIDSIKSGFQKLYSIHLTHIDGLRKCKEGMISSSDLQRLLDSNNEMLTKEETTKALMEQAHAAEMEKQRTLQHEEIASKHKELILKLENQVNQLRLRETAWERTISELVARKDILERRENAWTRTIGELMADIEIRNKREWWWEEMKHEMEGRIGGLSYHAVLER